MADHDLSLEYECPICGAQEMQKCATLRGNFRSESHIERRWIARDHQPKPPITHTLPDKRPPNR
jgi:hypothetical protein